MSSDQRNKQTWVGQHKRGWLQEKAEVMDKRRAAAAREGREEHEMTSGKFDVIYKQDGSINRERNLDLKDAQAKRRELERFDSVTEVRVVPRGAPREE